ncbi:hypothetical protein HQ586_09625 [Candidatus Bathyarchaeota archaeon]|nr:hypothetical protein [Candidatus Bathyarchaeota archaeon]
MDPEILGRLTLFLDKEVLTEEGLHNSLLLMSDFRPLVGSIEDASFGFITGCAFALLVDLVDKKYDRDINDDEAQSFLNVMTLRSTSIKSKIREIMNL